VRLIDGQRERRGRGLRHLAPGFGLLATAALALHAAVAVAGDAAPPGLRALAADWAYCGGYLLAAAACAARATRARGFPWAVAAVGVAVWASAEIAFRLVEPDPTRWYPPVTQGLLFVGFLIAYVDLVLLARNRVRRLDPVLALDGLIAGLACAALAAWGLFPVLTGGRTLGPDAPPQAFLLAALVGLAFVVCVLGLTGWRPGAAWALITGGIAVNVAGDVLLVRMVQAGTFHRGSLADTLFVASALALGLAALLDRPEAPPARPRARRLPVPLALALVSLALLVGAATLGGVGGLAVALAAAALLATLARMTVALELLERSRREALTDPLTGLGNRRALMLDLERRLRGATPAEPATLALFDLDGFKRYNDAFGHPSGDALLALLADRLAAAVEPGTAYRMGGDEFCVLLEDGEGERTAAALAAAEAALTERGEAFTVGASWGAVTLPAEAATVRDALHVSDSRMYARKRSRRPDAAAARDALLRVMREREPELREHLREVAALAVRVAARLGLAPEARAPVAHAAELHDIGKVAVPDAILHKPGRLDDEEWRVMRQHTLVGERILRASPALDAAATLVRSSHERWDGTGYPDGLAGEEIPLGARVIAVCDAYDAMRSHRAYDGARDMDDVLEELERCAGSQFDPAVVEAFCDEVRRRAGRAPTSVTA
jgi:diguanylate cyclase (GGDEF)-like protein